MHKSPRVNNNNFYIRPVFIQQFITEWTICCTFENCLIPENRINKTGSKTNMHEA